MNDGMSELTNEQNILSFQVGNVPSALQRAFVSLQLCEVFP